MRFFGNVMYLCDGKQCEGRDDWAGCDPCHHTTNPEHALHPDADLKDFIARPSREDGKVDLWEPYD